MQRQAPRSGSLRQRGTLALAAAALLALAACSDAGPPASLTLSAVGPAPPSGAAGEPLPLPLVVAVEDAAGNPAGGIVVDLTVELGGGGLEESSASTDADGQASFVWTLGRAPVANRVVASAGGASVAFETRATLAAPYEPAPFGDVNAFLDALGIEGSTEDLAFTPDGERLLLGVPGGLIALDASGTASEVALSGDPLVGPLGIAFDRAGNLWVADSAGDALRRISPDGEVVTVLTSDGQRALEGPNYVAIGPDDKVYLSDPCLGELIRYDPVAGRVDAVETFDLQSEGGPNGFAFDAAGARLWLATENTGLLCGHSFVGITDPIASLFAIDVDESGFAARETVVADVALFGDGVAFDVEGNLYAIFDTEMDFMLEESAIWVLPAGGRQLEKLAAVRGRVLANLAFGSSSFGSTNLYIALLSVPPFTPTSARGAELLELGIGGLPLLP